MSNCVFCGRQAVKKNQQNFAVCIVHKEQEFPDMKCHCGEYLDVRESKYGAFFLCANCGPVSVKKAMESNDISTHLKKSAEKEDNTPTEITVRSDEVDFI